MKFFKGFLVFILIAIIVGGIGYVGYSFLFVDHSGHNMGNMTASQSTQSGKSADTADGSSQSQQSTPGTQQQDSAPNQSQQNSNNQASLGQSNTALQNKDELGKSISTLNEALRLMSVDPYAPSSNSSGAMNGMQSQQGTSQTGNTSGVVVQDQTGNTPPATAQGNNTTINIYPQGSAANTQPGSMNTMQNMGTTYDSAKMEQLHAGLYKISVGMALLDQLNNELVNQAGYVNANTENPVQYYSNQYYITVQNKNKLSQATTYINEAANLVNINPYVSASGLVYDKDRMNQLHQSVFKLASGVASLNQLNDNFTKQSINLSNTVQNYINNAANNNTMNMPMNMSTGLFDNINLSSIVNIILIVFVIGLIFGIFGFVFSLLKGSGQKTVKKEDNIV